MLVRYLWSFKSVVVVASCAVVALAFSVAFAQADGSFPTTLKLTPSSTQAGASTGLLIEVERPKDKQLLEKFSLQLPPGLMGSLGSVPACPVDSAKKGDCSSDSQIGTAKVTVDILDGKTWEGKIYLTGPYGDAPAGLAIVFPQLTAAGLQVPLAKIKIRPEDAGITAISEGLPTYLLDIVPIGITALSLNIDRAGFLVNGTNCEEAFAKGSFQGFPYDPNNPKGTPRVSGTAEASYRVTGCENLPFNPQFNVRAGGPGLNAKGAPTGFYTEMTQQPGEASLKGVEVTLPEQIGPNFTALGRACPSIEQFNADQCPPGSHVGSARADTPLLPAPLQGSMQLIRSASGGLEPELGLKLDGPFGVSLRLRGQVVFVEGGRYMKTVFPQIPDVPLSRLILDIPGGAGGILSNRRDLCAGSSPATVQNALGTHFGRAWTGATPIQVAGCKPRARAVLKRGKAVRSKKSKGKRGRKQQKTRLAKPTLTVNVEASPPGTRFVDVKVFLPKQLKIDRKRATSKGKTGVLTVERRRLSGKAVRLNTSSVVLQKLGPQGTASMTLTLKNGALRSVRKLSAKSKLQIRVQTLDSAGVRSRFSAPIQIKR